LEFLKIAVYRSFGQASAMHREVRWLLERPMVCVLFVWALLCIVGYHGFSSSAWTLLAGGDGRPWIGTPQGVRSDDWMVALPMQLSQAVVKPAFPALNPSIGLGEPFLITPYAVPVRHWSTLFKPQNWGFFIGFDFGLSWLWNFRVFACILAVYFLLCRFPGVRGWTPMAVAIGTVFSPLLQYWSHLPTLHLVYFSLIFGLILGGKRTRFVPGVGVGVCCAAWVAWAFTLYPPFVTPLLLCLGVLGLCIAPGTRGRFGAIAGPPLLAGALAALILGFWAWEGWPQIQAMTHTAYPGNRSDSGGHGDWLGWWVRSLVHIQSARRWQELGLNPCEAASVIHFIPLLLWQGYRMRFGSEKWMRSLVVGATGLFLVWLLYRWFGLPPVLARILGLTWSTVERSVILLQGLGVVAFGWFLSSESPDGVPQARGWERGLGLGVFLLLAGQALSLAWRLNPAIKPMMLTLALVCGYGWTSLQIYRARKQATAFGFLLLSGLSSFAFNPIELSGFKQSFDQAPLTRMVQSAARESPGRWIVANTEVNLISFPLALGLPSLTYVQHFPNLKLWSELDPQQAFEAVWNRYAHLKWVYDPHESAYRALNPRPDIVELRFGSPYLERLRRLEVRNFLVPCDSAWRQLNELEELARERDWCVLRWRSH